jgi:hypothetical protein
VTEVGRLSGLELVGGRKVSGTLQHAFQPATSFDPLPPLPPTPISAIPPLAHRTSSTGDEISECQFTPSEGDEFELTHGDRTRIVDPNEDELWMSHVRQQLGLLFPDYTNGGDILSTAPLDVEEGMGWRGGSVLEGELVGNGQAMPTFRAEIGGLKQEIERLRGMVGGLAQGLRRHESGDAVSVDENGRRVSTEGDVAGFGRTATSLDLPPAFLQVSFGV